jgi:hypothetical protein
MRIDSKLMKTEMEVESIERQEDRLLMKSPPEDWNKTKVYLSAMDVVNMIRISMNRDMLGYVLLLPFFVIADFLSGERDLDEIMVDVSFVIASIFMGLLLIGGSSFLLTQPVTGAIVLGVLAGLFLLVAIFSDKSIFLYLGVPLTVITYFLIAYSREIPVADFPQLALVVVLSLLILGKALGREDDQRFAAPLFNVGYLIILLFVCYIGFNARIYAIVDPWGAVIPLLGFSLFHFVRYLDTRDPIQQYISMPLLGAGLLLVPYGIPLLPLPFYGLVLIAFSMGMILIADRYHESSGMTHVMPAYFVAILLALFAFAYAWRDLTALLLTLALFSVNFFGGARSLSIKTTASNWGEKTLQQIEFALANIAAGLSAVLILTIGRESWASVISVICYVYFYFKIGLWREPTILKTRNQYLWAGGAFYSLGIFVVLGLIDPLHGTQNDMLLVPFLLLPLLIFGRRLQRQGQGNAASSVYESSVVAVTLSLLLPTVVGNLWVPTAFAVAGIETLLFLVLALLWHDEVLLYPLPILAANLMHNALIVAGVSGTMIGLSFAPVALITMVIALFLYRRKKVSARTFFLAWFVFSAASIWRVQGDFLLLVYLISGFAALYLLATTFIQPDEHLQPIAEMESHV